MPSSVFITGAASGIGRATALYYARQGWYVGAFDIDEVGLASLRSELGADKCITGVLDTASYAAWTQALTRFWHAAGEHLDVLVNNAGILSHGQFAEIPAQRHALIVQVNVTGVMNGCHAAHGYLKQTPGSCVVNLASAGAIYGQASLASYSSTKFAVRGLTEALDIEWQPDGIRVKSVWPLFVQTGMVKGMDIASVRALGIKLTAEDVAHSIWQASQDKGRLSPVHYAVGFQAKALNLATKFSPAVLNRLVSKYISSQH